MTQIEQTGQDGGGMAERPFAEPDCFGFRKLEDISDGQAFVREMAETWRGKVQWARFTIVSEEFPNPPYPPGWYFEGWKNDPARMDPPHREAPFNYPLTANAVSPGDPQ